MDLLKGIRVIDVTMFAFVPAVGGVLAHWGADVIKVESPRMPDPMRLQQGGTLEPGKSGYLFKHYSRGKRSIAIDLGTDKGREILYKLCEDADVFTTSFLADTRKRLKFDVDDIKAINPRIVYVRGSGQGPLGPDAGRGGYDAASWWCRGTLAKQTMDVTGIDWPSGMIGHGDGMSGMTLVAGVCAALLHRERTGVAPVVDGSLMGTAIWFNGFAITAYGLGVDPPGRVSAPRESRLPNMNMYRTQDDRFIQLLMLGNDDRDWVDLCEHLERPDLVSDQRFATAADRQANCGDGVRIFDEVFAQRTLEEWKEILQTARGVWSWVQNPDEIFEDPQTLANGFIREAKYSNGGSLRLPAPPIMFDEDAGEPPRAPDFAEHTDEVLAEIGIDKTAADELRAAGVVK